jgi:hypothetical protein
MVNAVLEGDRRPRRRELREELEERAPLQGDTGA